jgi:hypothetical protein
MTATEVTPDFRTEDQWLSPFVTFRWCAQPRLSTRLGASSHTSNIPLDAHARNISHALSAAEQRKSLGFQHYVYLFSFPKITARLHMRIPGSTSTFMDLCLKDITADAIRAGYIPPASDTPRGRHSETFIFEHYHTLDPRQVVAGIFPFDFDWEQSGKGRRLVLNRENEVRLWTVFQKLLEALSKLKQTIEFHRQKIHTGRYLDERETAQVIVFCGLLSILELLVHRSCAFRRLSLNKAVIAAITKAQVCCRPKR